MGELRSNHYAAPATADFPEPLQASLSLAHKFIAQGNTTAALQVVFEALRTVCGETAAQNAAARVGSHLLHLHLQPQQASSQSAADQLADILTGCRIADNQVCFDSAALVLLSCVTVHWHTILACHIPPCGYLT
ncbi:TPA: hypothetical protein ACH3X2_005553 [Trebouxia sp. C0005]